MNWISFPPQAMNYAEPALNVLVLGLVYRVGLSRRLPAILAFLVLRLVCSISLLTVLHSGHILSLTGGHPNQLFFYGFWASYAGGAVAAYFVVQQVFRDLMRPVPDLSRLGMIAFRWVSIVSVLITLGAVALPALNGGFSLGLTTVALMRSMSTMMLCLLAFLALTMRMMRVSLRSPLSGIGLGFGLQALLDLLLPVLLPHAGPGAVQPFLLQVGPLLADLVWAGYCLLPRKDAAFQPATLPVSSPLVRWNEIAKALGHSAPHVAVGPSQAFFLQDVEGVVDKVLTKNSISVNS